MYTYIFFFLLVSATKQNCVSVSGNLRQQEILGKTCSFHGHGVKVVPRGASDGVSQEHRKQSNSNAAGPASPGPRAAMAIFLFLLALCGTPTPNVPSEAGKKTPFC